MKHDHSAGTQMYIQIHESARSMFSPKTVRFKDGFKFIRKGRLVTESHAQ